MKKFFLLDAFTLIYRAHFAFIRRPLINSRGLDTSVMFGFLNALLIILKKENPTHIAAAFDTKEPTFRHRFFPDYKIHRQIQPQEITIAIPYVRKIVEAFKIPIFEASGYEADDIIGTIATKTANKSCKIYIVTSDKDFGQLVTEHIYLYKPPYMGSKAEVLNTKKILAKWKIQCTSQVKDILGLQGDASDNIPGIPGIGIKTAAKLLKEFSTIENLIQRVAELKGKQYQKIIEFGQQALLSKKLATIDTQVPIDFEIDKMAYGGFNKTDLKSIFRELEFRTLPKRLFNIPEKTESSAYEKMRFI